MQVVLLTFNLSLVSLCRSFLCLDACHIWLPVAMKSVNLWRNLCASLLYFVVRVQYRR